MKNWPLDHLFSNVVIPKIQVTKLAIKNVIAGETFIGLECKARLVGPKNACGLLVVTIDNLELDKVTATLRCAMWLSVPAQWG